jgi:hypothetical protein
VKPAQVIRCGVAAVAIVLGLAACGVSSSTSDSASSSSASEGTSSSPAGDTASPPASDDESTLPAEPTGPESPLPGTHGGGSISAPPLPIGVSADTACVTVNVLLNGGNPLPAGYSITVTRVLVTPNPPVAVVDEVDQCSTTCGKAALSASELSCQVAVTDSAGTIDPDGQGQDQDAFIELDGRLECPSTVSSAACQSTETTLTSGGGKEHFTLNVIESSATPTTPATSEPATSEPASSSAPSVSS